MKAFLACLNNETNSFSPFPTAYRSFAEQGYLVRHGQHVADMKDATLPIFAFRRLAEAAGWQVVEGLCAIAVPSGVVTRAAYEALRDEILADLAAALPVEVVFLDLHGAMVADGYADCEGDLLARIRQLVGPQVPIGAVLDPHCHLTCAKVEHATLLVLLKEYPHTDFAERTAEVFRLLVDTLEGRIRPNMAVFDCRMIIAALHTTREPGRGLVAQLKQLEADDPDVLSISICHGMTWGDVPEMGAKILVVTDHQPEKGAALAEKLGRQLFDLRSATRPGLLSLAETLKRTLHLLSTNPGKPVVISDFTDNPGGGAPGDSTFILRALLEHGIEGAAIATLWDPVAVGIASDAGVGAWLNLRIGGKMGPTSGDPLDVYGQVTHVGQDVTHTYGEGNAISIGDAVTLRVRGIEIILNTQRTQIFGADCLSRMGIDPAQARVIVVKSSQHFYASFAPIAAEVLYCLTPGTLVMDIASIPYQQIDRNKWPLVSNPFAE